MPPFERTRAGVHAARSAAERAPVLVRRLPTLPLHRRHELDTREVRRRWVAAVHRCVSRRFLGSSALRCAGATRRRRCPLGLNFLGLLCRREADFDGTLMRHFLAFPIPLLTIGVFQFALGRLLIPVASPSGGLPPAQQGAPFGAIDLAAIAVGANANLGMAARAEKEPVGLQMLSAGGANRSSPRPGGWTGGAIRAILTATFGDPNSPLGSRCLLHCEPFSFRQGRCTRKGPIATRTGMGKAGKYPGKGRGAYGDVRGGPLHESQVRRRQAAVPRRDRQNQAVFNPRRHTLVMSFDIHASPQIGLAFPGPRLTPRSSAPSSTPGDPKPDISAQG